MDIPNYIQDLINEITTNLVIIEDHAESKKTYNQLIEKFYDYAKQGFEYRELRTAMVPFKFFKDIDDQYVYTLELRHFITNLIMWSGLVKLDRFNDITPEHIMDCTKLNGGYIKNYIDKFIIIPYRSATDVSNKRLNGVCHDIIHRLSIISTDFNIILGLSINIEVFIEMAEKFPEFNDIIRTSIDEDMQPNEIEAFIEKRTEDAIKILKDNDNMLQPIFRSGTGIKAGQFGEFAVNGGLKPDDDGNTIPIPINTNFIVGGLHTPSQYYIDSIGGRKALIMAKSVMGKSGHFARMIMLLTTNIRLSKKIDDCGSVRPIELVVRNKKYLDKLIGRHYRLPNSRIYHIIRDTDTDLIGKTIYVRSPITCTSKKICKTCYGELYHTNINIRSVGGLAGTMLTRPLSQNILSAKHLLKTVSDKLEFNEEAYIFFSHSSNELMMNTFDDDDEDFDVSNYSMIINKEDVIVIDQFDDSEFNTYITSFKIRNKKTGQEQEMREAGGSDLYLYPEVLNLMRTTKKPYYEIDLNKFTPNDRLFAMEINNRELTRPLYSIMNLLNRKDREGCETIDEMAQMLLDLIMESKIDIDSVHAELIIKPLIRSESDILADVRFDRWEETEKYRILTVDSALQNHPSVTISLAYQNLGKQFIRPVTYRKRGQSFLDPFFMERIKK